MSETYKIGINGLGRIGRNILRQLLNRKDFDLVFINDPQMTPENLAYLLKFDTTYGRLGADIQIKGQILKIDGKPVNLFCVNDPLELRTRVENLDLIFDCSGLTNLGSSFKSLIDLEFTKKVVCTFSNKKYCDISLVLGVNDTEYKKQKHHYISGTICDVVSLSPIIAAVKKQTEIKLVVDVDPISFN